MLKNGFNKKIDLITIKQIHSNSLPSILNLYISSFPKQERKSALALKHMLRANIAKLYRIYYKDKYCGFLFCIFYKRLVLIDYIAIKEDKRGLGIGGMVCCKLFNMFKFRSVFLEIEKIGHFKNNPQRKRRKSFYLKNGLFEVGVSAKLYGTQIELLSFKDKISFLSYKNLLLYAYKDFFPFLKLRRMT